LENDGKRQFKLKPRLEKIKKWRSQKMAVSANSNLKSVRTNFKSIAPVAILNKLRTSVRTNLKLAHIQNGGH